MSNENRVPSNVKDNADDAKAGAQKRMRNLDSELRKIRNTASWKLSDAERLSMANHVLTQAEETAAILMGTIKQGESQFTF